MIYNIFNYLKENKQIKENFYLPIYNVDKNFFTNFKNDIKLLTQIDTTMTDEHVFNVVKKIELEPSVLSKEEKNNRKIFLLYCVSILNYLILNIDEVMKEKKILQYIDIYKKDCYNFDKEMLSTIFILLKRSSILMIDELKPSYIIYGVISLIIIVLIIIFYYIYMYIL